MTDTVRCQDCGKFLLDSVAQRYTVFESGVVKNKVVWLEPSLKWFCPEGQCRVRVTRGMR